MPQKYEVKIIYSSVERVELEAESHEDALQKVKDKFYKGELINAFDDYDFSEKTDFEVTKKEGK